MFDQDFTGATFFSMDFQALQLLNFKVAHTSQLWNLIRNFHNNANGSNSSNVPNHSTPTTSGGQSAGGPPLASSTPKRTPCKKTPSKKTPSTKRVAERSLSPRTQTPKRSRAQGKDEPSTSSSKAQFLPVPSKLPAYLPNLPREGQYAYVRIDVLRTLKQHPNKVALIKAMKTGIFTSGQRNEWCRILLTEMQRIIKSWFPHKDAKLHLAMDIVHHFPQLRSVVGKPWDGYFNGKTGHLVTALNGLRASHNAKLRNVTRPQPKDEEPILKSKPVAAAVFEIPDEDADEDDDGNGGQAACTSQQIPDADKLVPADLKPKMVTLGLLLDAKENREEIFEGMRETFPIRKEMVKSNVPLSKILELFPKLLSYTGEIVDQEFSLHGLNCNEFLGNFKVQIEKQIIILAETLHPQTLKAVEDIGNGVVKALVLLPALCPLGNGHTASRKPAQKGKRTAEGKGPQKNCVKETIPHPALLQIVSGNVNVETYCSTHTRPHVPGADRGRKTCAPFLLWVTDDRKTGKFYLKLEHFTMSLGEDALSSFQRLLKIHFIFDLEYDKDLIPFWDVVEFLGGIRSELAKSQDEFLMLMRNMT